MLRAEGRAGPAQRAPRRLDPGARGRRRRERVGRRGPARADRFASIGLDLPLDDAELERELRRSIRAGIARADLDRLVVLNAKSLMERDADFSFFAGRILLTFVYEETLGWDIVRDGIAGLKRRTRAPSAALLERGVADRPRRRRAARLRPRPARRRARPDLRPGLRLPRPADALRPLPARRQDRRASRGGSRRRSSSGCGSRWASASASAEPTARSTRSTSTACTSERRFCSATPTLFNAGTPHSQLSSCYLYVIDDSLESIMGRGIAENAMCSKWAGGLGGSWTAVRGTGSHIQGTNGESQGVVPFLKLHNDQLVAVNQGGKRAGAGCAYLEVWHNDIRDFLELRRNTGDERRRTHDMNTACWIPDLFMKRVEAREHVDALPQLRRPRPARALRRGVRGALPRLRAARSRRARSTASRSTALELWKLMLKMLFETGHPWITFKDPCNVRSPQDHAGVIHSSQPLHRDHAQHERRGDRGLQPRLDRARRAPDRRRRDRPREAPRDGPGRGARARQRDRHQLLPDRGGADLEPAPPPGRPRRDGPAVRALPQGARVRLGRGASSSATS